jgi:hypothetical protein
VGNNRKEKELSMKTNLMKRASATALSVLVGFANPMTAGVLRAQGPDEGIKVHGHWQIEVHNSDGSLVSRHEFENALVGGANGGAGGIAALLSGTGTVGDWVVSLDGGGAPVGTFPCVVNPAAVPLVEWSCIIYSSKAPGPDVPGAQSKNLQVSVQAATVVLTGSITAGKNGAVANVQSMVALCDSSVLSVNCRIGLPISGGGSVQPQAFSSATLPSPVNVAAGQIIQLTVTLSFS